LHLKDLSSLPELNKREIEYLMLPDNRSLIGESVAQHYQNIYLKMENEMVEDFKLEEWSDGDAKDAATREKFFSQTVTKEGFDRLVDAREIFAEFAVKISHLTSFGGRYAAMAMTDIENAAMHVSKAITHESPFRKDRMEPQEQQTP